MAPEHPGRPAGPRSSHTRRDDSGKSQGDGGYRPRATGGDRGYPPRRDDRRGRADTADRSWRDRRPDEPALPDDIEPADLDASVRRDLIGLDKNNATTVARHLAMTGKLMAEGDPRDALEHARAARARAGRIAVVRETAGIAAYHAGEWAEALAELRAARRMGAGPGLLAVMADCERGLGRPEKALELGRTPEARALTGDDAVELRIVLAGARMDQGQYDQAVVTLQGEGLDASRTGSAAARLNYAYAEALLASGRRDQARTWFLNAAAADDDDETDAADRADELTD
jgi:tetratricopeptide (TPR) repeat protein